MTEAPPNYSAADLARTAYGATEPLSLTPPRVVYDAWNPLPEHVDYDRWGGVTRIFWRGATACVGCGAHASVHLVVATESVPLCAVCQARWESLGEVAHSLAEALVIHRCPEGLDTHSETWIPMPTFDELRARDRGVCRLCGGTNELEAGHVLSRNDGYKSTENWNIPRVVVDHPLNVVLLCKTCNHAIGKASPSLRIAAHFLMKPWTADPTAAQTMTDRGAGYPFAVTRPSGRG